MKAKRRSGHAGKKKKTMTNENILTDIARITDEEARRSGIGRERDSVAVNRDGRERPKRPDRKGVVPKTVS